MQRRMDLTPYAMRARRRIVEHPFGTIKAWMGSTHFLMKQLPNVKTEIGLHVLAYNLKRVMAILSAHAAVYNCFNVQPHLISRPGLRQLRAGAHQAWAAATVAA